MSPPRELRIVLRRCPKAVFTTFFSSASEQGSSVRPLRSRRRTPLFTFGMGRNTVSSTVNRYSQSYHSCSNTLRMPYVFEPSRAQMRSATSRCSIPEQRATLLRCSSTRKKICVDML